MQRMPLISHGHHIVVEPLHSWGKPTDARVFWGHIELGMITDDPKRGMSILRCLHDARFETCTFGREDQRVAQAVDRLVSYLMVLASDRHTPPVVETVEDEDED